MWGERGGMILVSISERKMEMKTGDRIMVAK